jgi:hypothetical protein
MKKTILLSMLLCIAILLQAQVSKTVNIIAGGLSAALTTTEKNTITNLTITGTIDARDFKTMRDSMAVIAVVDMGSVNILAYTGTNGTEGSYECYYCPCTIPQSAFYNPITRQGKTSLTSLIFPLSITSIGSSAFLYCSGLFSVTIPASVNSIGIYAFFNCSKINSIYVKNPSPMEIELGNAVFFLVNENCKLYVPFGSKSAYQIAEQWSNFSNIIESPGLFLSSSTLKIGLKADTIAIIIGSSENWAANLDEGWLSLSAANGPSGRDTLVLITTKNTSTTDRIATVTITTPSFEPQTIFVTQYCTKEVTAGGLKDLLGEELGMITSLTLSGTIDARDFKTMRDDMYVLEEVDLSEVAIVEYVGNEGTFTTTSYLYPANTIPINAFHNYTTNLAKATLKSIILPSSVILIDLRAFQGCPKLTTVTIPPYVKEINSYAFEDCVKLKSINFPNGLTDIGYFSFNSCKSIPVFTIPSTVSSIGVGAFMDNPGLINVVIDNQYYSSIDGVLFNLNKTALLQCPISKTGNYTIPLSVTTIQDFAFLRCSKLTGDFTIPETVTSIGLGAFEACTGLTAMEIPSSVTIIKDYTFLSCTGLKTLTIPSSVTTIGFSAFDNCNKLETLTIPFSVSSIAGYAFRDCGGLRSIYSYNPSPVDLRLSESVFSGIDRIICKLYVPIGATSVYKAANQWKDFKNIIEIPFINLSDTIVHLPAMEGSSDSIFITSNNSWEVILDQSWISVNPTSGVGNDTLIFTANANPTIFPRTAQATISTEGIDPKIVAIDQEAGDTVFSVSSTIVNLDNATHRIDSIFVLSNIRWNAVSDQAWLTVTPDMGIGNDVLIFSSAINPEIIPRNATITISAEGVAPYFISVKQEAGDTIFLISSNTVDLGIEEGSSDSIFLTSNISWEAVSDQSWLTVSPETGTGNDTLIFVAKANATTSIRSSTVTLTATSTFLQSIVITQDAFNLHDFVARAVSSSQIDLSWLLNPNDDPVLVAFSENNIFGIPVNETEYAEGDSIPGGGTILYYGTSTSYSHISLSSNSTYYYRAWTNTDGTYSTPVNCEGKTFIHPETRFPYNQDFSTGLIPDRWSIIDNQGNGQIWKFDNPGGRIINTTTGTNGFAIIDSDEYGYGNSQKSDLISPPFDFSEVADSNIVVEFEYDYKECCGSSATFSFSIDNGSTWVLVKSFTDGASDVEIFYEDLTLELAGKSNVFFKWSYSGSNSYYWAIDDVNIRTLYCNPVITFPYSEDFSSGRLPDCWSIEDHEGNGQVWSFNNPEGRNINTTTNKNGFAIIDSDYFGSGNTQNCDLISPEFDFTLETDKTVMVKFEHYFDHYYPDSASFSYTIDHGVSWILVKRWTSDTPNPGIFIQNFTSTLAGQPSVIFKWSYYGSYANYWAIDDFEIYTLTCNPVSSFPYSEEFSTGKLPDCWWIEDHEGNEQVWAFNNPGKRVINTTTNGNGFAIIDSYFYGNGNTQKSDLISPEFDFTIEADNRIQLTFEHYFKHKLNSDSASFSYTLDHGASWIPVKRWTSDSPNPEKFNKDFTSQLAGQPSVFFKWSYYGSYANYWAIDDIHIYTFLPEVCEEISSFPYIQDFSSGTIPECWSVVDNVYNSQVWTFNNPGGRIINSTTSGNGFIIIDSDNYGSGNYQNSDLVSPVFDFSGIADSHIVVKFEHFYNECCGSSATFSYSTDNGNSWVQVKNWSSSTANVETFLKDFAAELTGQSQVKFKWSYTGESAEYWAIDDIHIFTFLPEVCEEISSFPYIQDFSSRILPNCWSIVDHQGNGQVWTFDNPGERTINTPTSGNGFAILDSDYYGRDCAQNSDLISPVFDFSQIPNGMRIILEFSHFFSSYDPSSGTLSYSIDDAATWNEIQTWSLDTENPENYSIYLTDELKGESQVKFKWNYYGANAWYWAVDDLKISVEEDIMQETIHISDTIINTGICFNAYDTITVAGDGSSVEFQSGSSVDLIAGSTIRFLPGFHALEGSVAHAWITTDSTFCDGASGSIVQNPQVEKSGDAGIDFATGKVYGNELKVYPNPNRGKFTIEIIKAEAKVEIKAEVKVYNALGERVYQAEMQDRQSTIDLSGIRRGLYVVMITDGQERFMRKVMVE